MFVFGRPKGTKNYLRIANFFSDSLAKHYVAFLLGDTHEQWEFLLTHLDDPSLTDFDLVFKEPP